MRTTATTTASDTSASAPVAAPEGSEDDGTPDVIWKLRHIASEMPAGLLQAFSTANMSQSELNQLDVQRAISRWQRMPLDTGSGEVQVAILTVRIQQLAAHLQRHHKDKHSKRRLSMLVSQRNRVLKYLRRKQRERYMEVISGLNIRATKAFDPTLMGHPQGNKTSWAAKGLNKHTPKKRKKRATPYGEAKSPKGRTRLVKHAVRQRRLLKRRLKAAAARQAADASPGASQ